MIPNNFIIGTMTNLTERFVVGRIGKPRGLKGELRVFPLTDNIQRFKDIKVCYVEDQAGKIKQQLQIEKCSIVHTQVFIKFKDISNRNSAEKIKNLFLSLDRAEAIELSADSYFIADLIGCSVFDQEKGYLGDIAQIDKNISNDVVIVKKAGEKDLLYPNLKSIVKNVDLSSRRVDVVLPDGLYEIYR